MRNAWLFVHNLTDWSCSCVNFPTTTRARVQIVRGAETNIPIIIGGVTVPLTGRMNLQITNATYAPLDYVTLVDAPSGNGLLFHHTLTFTAGNLNTLEGCYHAYTPYSAAYPGLLMSTGTEDYYDSVRTPYTTQTDVPVVL